VDAPNISRKIVNLLALALRVADDGQDGARVHARSPPARALRRRGASRRRGQAATTRLAETDVQARLDAARMRLRELVVFGMRTWLSSEALKRLRDAEEWRRGEVRLHFQVLARFREEQRRRREERHFTS
jgi:hypothetical protein